MTQTETHARCVGIEDAEGRTIEAVIFDDELLVITFDDGDWAEISVSGHYLESEPRSGALTDVLSPEQLYDKRLITNAVFVALLAKRKADAADANRRALYMARQKVQELEAALAEKS